MFSPVSLVYRYSAEAGQLDHRVRADQRSSHTNTILHPPWTCLHSPSQLTYKPVRLWSVAGILEKTHAGHGENLQSYILTTSLKVSIFNFNSKFDSWKTLNMFEFFHGYLPCFREFRRSRYVNCTWLPRVKTRGHPWVDSHCETGV